MRKLEKKAAKVITQGDGAATKNKGAVTALVYDTANVAQPPYQGDEMASVQAECQKMLDRLNAQILNARGVPPPAKEKQQRPQRGQQKKQVTADNV